MNYRKEILKLLKKIKDETFLRQVYIIVKRHLEKEQKPLTDAGNISILNETVQET